MRRASSRVKGEKTMKSSARRPEEGPGSPHNLKKPKKASGSIRTKGGLKKKKKEGGSRENEREFCRSTNGGTSILRTKKKKTERPGGSVKGMGNEVRICLPMTRGGNASIVRATRTKRPPKPKRIKPKARQPPES